MPTSQNYRYDLLLKEIDLFEHFIPDSFCSITVVCKTV